MERVVHSDEDRLIDNIEDTIESAIEADLLGNSTHVCPAGR